MPIRTPHGRSAAYRVLWQWPLRSPARLAITAVVVLAVVGGIGFGIGTLNGGGAGLLNRPTPSSQAARPAPPSAQAVPTALPPVRELTPSALPISQAPPAALDVAQRWTRAWVRPPDGTSAAQWLDKLRPLTTDEYLGVLSSVDPGNIRSTRVTGPVRAVSVAPRSVRVQVSTDAATLVIVVVSDGPSGWRVADYDEA